MTPTVFYEDEHVTLWHGDCRDVLPTLAPVDVVVTDPPYGIGWRRAADPRRGSKAHAGIANDESTSTRDEVLELLADTPAVVFGSFYAPFPARLRQVLVWPKAADAGVVGATTGFRRDAEPVFLVGPWPTRRVAWSSVLPTGARSAHAEAAATGHPHTKPVAVMRTLIERCPGGIVLDPFAGSGSTLLAARELGRRAIGVEIDEGYCRAAAKRLAAGQLFDALDGEAA